MEIITKWRLYVVTGGYLISHFQNYHGVTLVKTLDLTKNNLQMQNILQYDFTHWIQPGFTDWIQLKTVSTCNKHAFQPDLTVGFNLISKLRACLVGKYYSLSTLNNHQIYKPTTNLKFHIVKGNKNDKYVKFKNSIRDAHTHSLEKYF